MYKDVSIIYSLLYRKKWRQTYTFIYFYKKKYRNDKVNTNVIGKLVMEIRD